MRSPRFSLFVLLASACLFSACNLIPEPREDPTRYYTLNLSPEIAPAMPAAGQGLKIGLRAIDVPAYLRKGVLAVREVDTELRFNEYARWAEPLEAGLTRLLVTQLQADPRVAKVSKAPLPLDDGRDYEIFLQIRAAEGLRNPGKNSVLFCTLVEITDSSGQVISRQLFTAKDLSWDGKDAGLLAQQLSKAVQALATDILGKLPAAKPAQP